MRQKYLIWLLLVILCLSSYPQGIAQTSKEDPDLVIVASSYITPLVTSIQDDLQNIGFNVEIKQIPYYQFYLEVLTNPDSTQYDLAIGPLQDNNPVKPRMFPSTQLRYSSTDDIAKAAYELGNTTYLDLLKSEVNVDQKQDVDPLIEMIKTSTDGTTVASNLNAFLNLYYGKLLYDLPLFAQDKQIIGWKGYQGWDKYDGILDSRKLGASWNSSTSAQRFGNKSTIRLPLDRTYGPVLLDPYRLREMNPELGDIFSSTLLSFDGHHRVHPDIAYNFIQEDWDVNGDGSDIVKGGKFTFFIDTTHQFPATTTIENNSTVNVPAEHVDANDFGLTLDLMADDLLESETLYGATNFKSVVKWESTSTTTTNDTLVVYLNTTSNQQTALLGSLYPLPDHILGGNLTTTTGESFNFRTSSLPARDSVEFQHYYTLNGSTQVSAMQFKDIIVDNTAEQWNFEANPDFPFTNEWDAESQYASFKTEFDNYPTAYNLSYFAPHIYDTPPEAYYWAYADNPSTQIHEKPTSQTISYVKFRTYGTGSLQEQFMSGEFDFVMIPPVQRITVDLSSDQFSTTLATDVAPIRIFFNQNRPILQKYDVRKAIIQALELDTIETTLKSSFPGFRSYHLPISPVFDYVLPMAVASDFSWYTTSYNLNYNQQVAQNTLKTYFNLNIGSGTTNTASNTNSTQSNPGNGKNGFLSAPWIAMISVIPMITVLYRRKRTNYS